MKKVLEDLIEGYLQGVDMNDISDARFRVLVDLYKDLHKENQPAQQSEEQAENQELAAFIRALQDSDI